MDEWHVGDPADWGDSVGVPDIPYMGYINDGEDEDEPPRYPQNPHKKRAFALKEEALRLNDQGRYSEALSLINRAIELDRNESNYYNVKAIILECSRDYDGALRYYNIALDMCYSKVYEDNKARLLNDIASCNSYCEDKLDYALDCINEALKITNDDNDRKTFLRTKADILEKMGRKIDSKICIYLANELYEKVKKAERQRELIENSTGTVICITGTEFYDKKVKEGDIVELIFEPDNEHDKDAIRIEKDDETVGYVANSPYTLVEGAKGASEVKYLMGPGQKAKVMFLYLDEYRIAKLI